ncbi:oxygen-independent coproporphyrinogen III oxidase [Maricaulis sp.]|uniref:oxygen-independent coproporphyrinogen III oxidase n=1 Tax=Maricaulis sp. TaxID=1486257 RepID=UPI000C627ADA|nr:oxygen-independent coproporphyrinogen III oxidase [Maricaulis sp.]MAC90075.1 oxygen-independent coproporphyrinogen III oxidase [Maricaulis sp.]
MPDDAPRFIAKYALEAVPRYTSYPPATKFHGKVGLADWQRWMTQQDKNPALSIYVHIPFCKSMCWYCGCHTTIPNGHRRVEHYLAALDIDIRRRAESAPPDGRVCHIHFGGGSPDMLKPEEFRAVMQQIRASFNVAPDAEIAVELDPRGLDSELCQAMAQTGVNRASLGVQDISHEVQKLIHRIQPLEIVQAAADKLRAVGISAINMDMMYGLPAQSVARVCETANAIAGMGADRVSVFGYAHVPWFKKHQRAIPEERLPGAAERFDQMLAANHTLTEAGYERIGFDHFARPADPLGRAARDGSLRRNFQGYTTDPSTILIGLGASAISECPQGYVQTEPNPVRYANAVTSNADMIVRGVGRSMAQQAVASRIANLLCQFETEVEPGDPVDLAKDMLADALVRIEDGRITLTEAGRPYVRNLAARVDPAFRSTTEQHSVAV